MSDIESARMKARTAYMAVACISALFGLVALVSSDNTAAFAGFTLASIQAVIIRHILLPNGASDLLRAFMPKPRAPR